MLQVQESPKVFYLFKVWSFIGVIGCKIEITWFLDIFTPEKGEISYNITITSALQNILKS